MTNYDYIKFLSTMLIDQKGLTKEVRKGLKKTYAELIGSKLDVDPLASKANNPHTGFEWKTLNLHVFVEISRFPGDPNPEKWDAWAMWGRDQFDGVFVVSPGVNIYDIGEPYALRELEANPLCKVWYVREQYKEHEQYEEEYQRMGVDYSPSCPWNAPGMSIHDFI